MPNIQSAKKNLRRIEKRRAVNKSIKSKIKTLKKKFIESLTPVTDEKKAAKNSPSSQKILSGFFKAVDKAAGQRIIKKNKAARYKSSLSKKLQTKAKA